MRIYERQQQPAHEVVDLPDGIDAFLASAKELTEVAASMGIKSATLDVDSGEVLVTYRGRTRPASEPPAAAP